MANTNGAIETPNTEMAALLAKLARLEAQIAAQKAAAPKLSLKISDKGGLSVYGVGRFPVTLYREQWERILDRSDDIRAMLPKLPTKAEKAAEGNA